jgi:hypothetical protein
MTLLSYGEAGPFSRSGSSKLFGYLFLFYLDFV